MYSHVVRSETFTFWGSRRYQLYARIHTTTPLELHIIHHHGLEALEVFHDPVREQLAAEAYAAHEQAKAYGLFVTNPRDALRVSISEIRSAVAAVQALRAFRITVADLLSGVTITHRTLNGIQEIERTVIDCIDRVGRTVEAARGYSDATQDIYKPDADQSDLVPPAQWPRTWRR